MINLYNVNKYYEKTQVLKDINLSINKGDIFGIIGLSGAGKSTLIRLLNGLEKATSGEIKVDGNNITHLSDKDLKAIRKNIGMIFQNFNLLNSKTVYKNIAFPLILNGVPKKEIKKRAQELINLVQLNGKENFYPRELSGGQKQRVGIARALSNNPKVLLCDEATSALDPATTKAILTLIKNIQKQTNLTVVLITHEMDVIQAICNKVAILHQGNIVEQGLTENIFHHPKQQITKEFVIKGYEHNDYDDINKVVNQIKGGKFIKLHYNESSIKDSVLSEITLQLGIKVNIIEAFINNVVNQPYPITTGQITAHIDVDSEKFQQVIALLKQYQIQIEVIDNEL